MMDRNLEYTYIYGFFTTATTRLSCLSYYTFPFTCIMYAHVGSHNSGVRYFNGLYLLVRVAAIDSSVLRTLLSRSERECLQGDRQRASEIAWDTDINSTNWRERERERERERYERPWHQVC